MSDAENLDLGEEGGEGGGGGKKPNALAALLPNLLKFVAIGLGALIFIVTVSVITYNVLNKSGSSATFVPDNSPWSGVRPQYSTFTAVGAIRTSTRDPTPYSVVVDMVIQYDEGDSAVATELTGRLYELQDFVRSYFRSKTAVELEPENEARLKQEIVEILNTRVLGRSKIRQILFRQLDVMEM